MLELLGGLNSKAFHNFIDVTIRGFLIARRLTNPLLTIIASMADSSLPCFMYKDINISQMHQRFFPSLRDSEAVVKFKEIIYDAANKWTTKAYDGIQKLQNNIYSDSWK